MAEDAGEPRILICDELAPAAMDVFRRRELRPEIRTGLSEAELVDAVGAFDAIIVRSATKLTRPVIEAARRLRVIGRAGIGVDNIDVDAATERGVVVMNTPLGNATTTAELAVALLLSLARHIPRADRMVRAGVWKKKELVGSEIAGKTLGVVGLGRIGRIVAERGRGLGMKVVAHDPYLEPDSRGLPGGVELMALDDLLERSDFVSIHVPLNDATRHLISWEGLARIKPGARLIDAARGGVVDEEAVLDALESGRLAGAAFDVFEQEPPRAEHPLLARDDVIVTPHLGASSAEAQLRVAVDIAEQITDYLLDGVATNAVNAPTLPAEALHEIAPFILLAERLGSFLAQRARRPIRKIELTVAGEITRFGIEHLRLPLLVGLLRHSLDGVNFVNAPARARERGIFVLERVDSEAQHGAGQILVRARERDGGPTHVVAGAVFGREPRIIRVDGSRLDLPPRGHLLITRHKDRPGVLGQIGSLLGDYDVNIQRLELGPPENGGDELHRGFLTLGSKPSNEVIEAIRGLEAIEDVQLVHL